MQSPSAASQQMDDLFDVLMESGGKNSFLSKDDDSNLYCIFVCIIFFFLQIT